jgi:VanZ family protein
MQLKNTVYLYWKSISVIACILYLSFAPPSTFEKVPTFEGIDKMIHFFMYLALSVVLILTYQKSKKQNTLRFIAMVVVFPCLLGGIIEILQPLFFFPRTASWDDWLFDIAGVLVAWFGKKYLVK